MRRRVVMALSYFASRVVLVRPIRISTPILRRGAKLLPRQHVRCAATSTSEAAQAVTTTTTQKHTKSSPTKPPRRRAALTLVAEEEEEEEEEEEVLFEDSPFTSPVNGKKPTNKVAYDASQITVLEFPENVRRRPGMYLGSSGVKGLHHMVWEILDNAIDEAMGGHASRVSVTLHADGSCSVRDDGRGIPCGVHPSTGRSALETVLCVLHAGGKFGGEASGYGVAGGLHGVGLSVVNALSERLDVQVRRDGRLYEMAFARGKPASELVESPIESKKKNATLKSGTLVTFLPDAEIFSTTALEKETLARRLDELAYLNAGLELELRDSRPKKKRTTKRGAADKDEPPRDVDDPTVTTFVHAGGIAEYADVLTRGKQPLHAILGAPKAPEETAAGKRASKARYGALLAGEKDSVSVECALRWSSDQYDDVVVSFVNGIRTADGGVHVDGLRAIVTRTVNSCAKKAGERGGRKLLKNDQNLPGEFVREGLTAVLSVKVPNAEFEGQTKSRLGSPGVRHVVEKVIGEKLNDLFERHPKALAAIVDKAETARAAAIAAKAARDVVRRKTVLVSSVLPGKLADCSSKTRSDTEIFIVEGDSAAGPAKQARERRTQAVLPLRGKILNVEKCATDKIYGNAEIQAMIAALGLGVKGEPFDAAKLRYGKVIIMTDADVDGAHIRSLILTFFFRYQREIVERGNVYIARPPLFKVDFSKASSGRGGASAQSQWDAYADGEDAFTTQSAAEAIGTTTTTTTPEEEEEEEEDVAAAQEDASSSLKSTSDDDEEDEIGVVASASSSSSSKTAKTTRTEKTPTSSPTAAKKAESAAKKKKKNKGGAVYCWSDEELAALLKEHTESGSTRRPMIQRFKGLGEMMANQLWDTTMDPQRRRLMRVDVEDAAQADLLVNLLMGDKVAERKDFIMSRSTDLTEDELDV